MRPKWTVASPGQVLNFCLFYFMMTWFWGALEIAQKTEPIIMINKFFLMGLWPVIIYGLFYALVSYLLLKRKQKISEAEPK